MKPQGLGEISKFAIKIKFSKFLQIDISSLGWYLQWQVDLTPRFTLLNLVTSIPCWLWLYLDTLISMLILIWHGGSTTPLDMKSTSWLGQVKLWSIGAPIVMTTTVVSYKDFINVFMCYWNNFLVIESYCKWLRTLLINIILDLQGKGCLEFKHSVVRFGISSLEIEIGSKSLGCR